MALHSEFIPVVFRGLYGILGIEHRLAMCKTITLPMYYCVGPETPFFFLRRDYVIRDHTPRSYVVLEIELFEAHF